MEIKANFTAASIGRFNAMLSRCAAETGKSLASIVEKASVYFCQSAGKATPVSKKRRGPVYMMTKKMRGPNREDRFSRGRDRWRYQSFAQHRAPLWFYIYDRMDPKREISNRGLAGNSWRALIRKFSTRISPTSFGGKRAMRNAEKRVRAHVEKGQDMAAVTMHNEIQYMQKIAPNVVPVALEKAHRRMAGWLKSVQQKQKATWAA